MKHHAKLLVTGALMALSLPVLRADPLVTYNLTEGTSRTVRSLGTSFVVGCAVLAVGMVVAAFIARKK